MEFLNKIVSSLKEHLSGIISRLSHDSKKDGVVGQINTVIEPDAETLGDVAEIDVSQIEKGSLKKITILIVILLIAVAFAAVLLWGKLTGTMSHFETKHVLGDTEVVVEQEASSGFLPGKTVVVEKKKPKPEKIEQNKEEPKAQEKAPEPKDPESDSKSESKPETDVKQETESTKKEAKPDESTKKTESNPRVDLHGIHLSTEHAHGISKTLNPQYLVENPILKTQKVVIILKGFGLNKVRSDAILDEIDEDIVVAVDPYSTNVQDEIELLQEFGLDVLVMIPLQDSDPLRDLGYMTIRTGMKPADRDKILSSIVDISVTSLGILLTGGRDFLKSDNDVNSLVSFFFNNPRFLVLENDVLNNKFFSEANSKKINYLAAIGTSLPVSEIEKVLGVIRRTGFALLSFDINEPDVALKINQWIKLLDENKIDVVSISNLLKKND